MDNMPEQGSETHTNPCEAQLLQGARQTLQP